MLVDARVKLFFTLGHLALRWMTRVEKSIRRDPGHTGVARVRNANAQVAPGRDFEHVKYAFFAPLLAAPPRQKRPVERRIPPVESVGSIFGQCRNVDEHSIFSVMTFAHEQHRLNLVTFATHVKIASDSFARANDWTPGEPHLQ